MRTKDSTEQEYLSTSMTSSGDGLRLVLVTHNGAHTLNLGGVFLGRVPSEMRTALPEQDGGDEIPCKPFGHVENYPMSLTFACRHRVSLLLLTERMYK